MECEMASCAMWLVRSKLILEDRPVEQVNGFKFLCYQLSSAGEMNIDKKLENLIILMDPIS